MYVSRPLTSQGKTNHSSVGVTVGFITIVLAAVNRRKFSRKKLTQLSGEISVSRIRKRVQQIRKRRSTSQDNLQTTTCLPDKQEV